MDIHLKLILTFVTFTLIIGIFLVLGTLLPNIAKESTLVPEMSGVREELSV